MKTTLLCIVIALAGIPQGLAISAGTVVQIEDHPYQVAIDKYAPLPDGDDDPSHITHKTTSGALLTSKTVITSARSLADKGTVNVNVTLLTVRVGAQRRDTGGASYKVVDYLLHPAYSQLQVDGDVLLLYLDAEVPSRSDAHTVPLADPSKTSMVPGEKLVLTGYGNLTQGEVLADGEVRQLQAAALPFVNQDVCKDIYRFYDLSTVRACAGGLAKATCGDGNNGAPVVNWRGELVGVASPEAKENCGVLGMPTVFTSLLTAEMHQWITSNADGKQKA
ncbi:Trypsin-1 [Frankliniella fusca]|uniref:Trypsin-1 n=1 Tax=Frankliniella fusca TaxID=407009 RepID=A0AAE1LTB6_9NEOP|nr:Trypsin-1 [Frankliniella fusca]